MEDDEGLAYLLSQKLKKAGYCVETASNGEEGLAKYARDNFDLLLVDYQMPVMGGMEVIKVMASKDCPSPVIVVTGHGDEASAVQALKAGASDYVIKDTDGGFMDLLPAVIEKTLQRHLLIKEKQETEKALRESEELLQNIVDLTPDTIYRLDAHGHFTYVSPGVINLGFQPEDLIGKCFTEIIHPDCRESANHRFNEKQTGNAAIRNFETRIIAPGDKIRDCELREVRVLFHATGLDSDPTASEKDKGREFFGIQGALRDITERKRTEEELNRYRNHLEQLVEKRTTELKSTQEKLAHADKLSALGKLVSSIAHEFNTPIYGVRNVLEQTRKEETLGEEKKHLLSLAIKECNRMADMIKRLQGFYRPSPGIKSSLNINQAIDDVILLMQKKLKQEKITVEKHYGGDLPDINAVEDQIKQVLLNLIQNSEEAINDKGGTITITTEAVDSMVKLRVKDTGGGITPENMKSIFEPFFTTKSETKGTGLGLAVTYGIIKSHGGNIWVESEPGKGTTFTVILPPTGC